MPEIFQVQAKAAIALNAKNVAQFIKKTWFTVGRQTHHFIFIAIMRETDELSERGIKNA